MKTFAITIELKSDPILIKKYIDYHKSVWPEVKASVARTGMRNVKIFMLGTRLVQIFEAEDAFEPRRDMMEYIADPKSKQWDEMMSEYQKPVLEAQEGEWWAQMTLVYDSNW
jgi:L-rhamnose mutarotase